MHLTTVTSKRERTKPKILKLASTVRRQTTRLKTVFPSQSQGRIERKTCTEVTTCKK
jgi:hypothetical protein